MAGSSVEERNVSPCGGLHLYNIKKLEELIAIWWKADKELHQCVNSFGNIATKEACAVGAIMFYRGRQDIADLNDDVHGHNWEEIRQLSFYDTLEALRKEWKADDITDLNDEQGWTFRDFAKAAQAILEREKSEK